MEKRFAVTAAKEHFQINLIFHYANDINHLTQQMVEFININKMADAGGASLKECVVR